MFWTTIVYVIGSPGMRVVPEAGEFDLTIVRTGAPMNVWTGGELTVSPLAASRPWSTIGFGSPSGTVAVKVSGGETRTLLDVAAGKATGPSPVAASLKVRLPGVAPAATVQVHS